MCWSKEPLLASEEWRGLGGSKPAWVECHLDSGLAWASRRQTWWDRATRMEFLYPASLAPWACSPAWHPPQPRAPFFWGFSNP